MGGDESGRICRISVSGIEAFAYHGCTPREKEEGQVFLIDIELEYDAAGAVEGDDLSRAVDYDVLVSQVHELATRERHDLIETLACRIGEHILRTTVSCRTLVRVHKPHVPLRKNVADVAVEMVFIRDV